MPNSKEATAYHEAGHAVAYFRLGKRIRKVTIVPNGEYQGCCFGYGKYPELNGSVEITPGIEKKVEQEIIILFAGSIAQAKYLGRNPRGWSKFHDVDTAINLGMGVNGSMKTTEAYLNWLFVATKEMFNQEKTWTEVGAIAQELLKKKTLSGKEAYAIWRDAYLKNIGINSKSR